MSPELALAARYSPTADTDAAVDVLRDPALPGEPWSDEEIADALPLLLDLADGGSLAVAATTARWLAAVDASAELPEDD